VTILYRISDGKVGSNSTGRITTKEECLRNFLWVWLFFQKRGDTLHILADNCHVGTHAMIRKATSPLVDLHNIIISNVHAGSSPASFRVALELALTLPDNEIVYFLEDDYLHVADARKVLLEGLGLASYVTLYDHPDKYRPGRGEMSEIMLTKSSHWKFTKSTTATFATTVETLRADAPAWRWFADGRLGAWDHEAFTALWLQNRRRIVSCIPGRATHTEAEHLSPLVDWRQPL
jgi:hypothetical protein